MVLMDVFEDGGIEKRRVPSLAVDLVAQLGAADVVVQVWEDGELGLLSCIADQAVLIGLAGEWFDCYAGGQDRGQIAEIFLGPRRDDEIGQEGQFGSPMPMTESAE